MNIRVLIVEDEPPIARSLSRTIERMNGDFRTEAFAAQGAEALDIVRSRPIDVVFTDIRMPVMDGIALLEALEREYPDVRKVAVSGYQDFDYVKKAMQYRAVDYLLKPVAEDELSALLAKIAEQLEGSRTTRRRRELSDLVHHRTPPADGSLWNSSRYAAGLVCAGPFPLTPSDSLSPASEFWNGTDAQALLNDLLQEGEQGWIVQGKTSAEIAVVVGFEEESRSEVLRSLFEALDDRGGAAITMSGSGAVANIGEVARLLPELRALLYRRTTLGCSQWLTPEEGPGSDSEGRSSEGTIGRLEAISSEWANRQWERLDRELQEWFAECASSRLPQAELVQSLNAVATRTRSRMKQAVRPAELDLEIREAVTNARDYDDLRRNLLAVFSEAGGDTASRGVPDVVADVERYLLKHYAEPITSELLSARFGFVPSYIGKLFRMHKGMSPAQFLVQTRIEHAKELLRLRPELQIKEIAEQVGYGDPLYFSRVFQKETGKRPSDYRNPS